MKLTRQEFFATLGAFAAGVSLDALDQRAGAQGDPTGPLAQQGGLLSFAQSGEDLIAHFICHYLQIREVNYLDVGAHDPIAINNTYFLYRRGLKGVLVEPNGEMCKKLRAVRPRDTTLEAGIGVTGAREADYYVMTDSAWNTFSKAEADHMTRVTGGRTKVERVIKVPMLDINAVMSKHLGGAPTFLSVDTEGLDLAILKTIDFKRFRPPVICAETLVVGTQQYVPQIAAFMESQQYVHRGGSFVNSIFVDRKLIRS